jgi:hypothetical protein
MLAIAWLAADTRENMPPLRIDVRRVSVPQDRNSIQLGVMAENIILVAGRDGGGTATFQNHLVRYLISAEENFSTELVLAKEHDSQSIQDEWRALWSEGKLPAGAGQPKNYAYRVQPLRQHKDKPPLDFAFREVSGEDCDALLAAGERQAGALPEDLTALLGNPELNFVLVLMCGWDEKAGQDAPLARFIAYLRRAYGEEFASRCPVLLLASKMQEDDGDNQGLEAFLGDNLPATLAALQDWQGRYTLGEFDAGEFEVAEDGDALLCSPKFEDTAKIFRWIYFQFTRYPVSEPFLARLWKSVRRAAS